MTQHLERLKAALADFRAANAAMWKVIREQPTGEARWAHFEAALRALVEAGGRLAEARPAVVSHRSGRAYLS